MNKTAFIRKLYDKLRNLKTKVEVDEFADGSSSWILIKTGDNKWLEISFDGKGENIEKIAMFEDIVQVVETKTLWKI